MLSIRVIGLLAGLITTTLLTRNLPLEHYGTVATAISIALVGSLVLSSNLGATVIRFLPNYQSKEHTAAVAGYLNTLRLSVLISLLVSWSVAALYAFVFRNSLSLHTVQSVITGLICIPFFAFIRIEGSIVHSLGKVLKATVANLLIRPVIFLLCILIVLKINDSLSSTLVLTLFVSTAAATCACQYFISRTTPNAHSIPVVGKPDLIDRRAWFQSALGLLLPTLYLEFLVDLTVLLSAIFLSPTDTAAVSVVMRLQSILMFGVTSINMTVAPRIAKAHASGDTAERSRLLMMSAHMKLWPSLAVFVALIVFSNQLLGIFGEQYQNYRYALWIVATTPLVLAFFGPTVLFTTVLNLQAKARSIFLLSFFTLVALIGIGGTHFGVNGVAGAVLVSWIGWNSALHWLIVRNSGFSTTPFIRSK